ncbi:MAG: FAD-dependent oxidoreductase [Burkholderiales bacterium]|nr:FAD-dependent oxidoreductase [Burkholderiales bacterium]
MTRPITIIGTGLAGYNLARELRKQDPAVALRIISADAGDFYSKPMLSNGLAGNKTAAQLAMKSATRMAEELAAEILVDTRVSEIDPVGKTVVTSQGRYEYSQLVLALGADPFKPAMTGDAVAEVQTINDLADYAVFRERLAGKQKVVLLGGGLIGCEFANDMAQLGLAVDVVELAAWPLSRHLPEPAGRYLQAALGQKGVRFHFNTTATSVVRSGEQYNVTLADGEALAADLVVSAIGLHPRHALAQSAGLHIHRGIVVDAYLRTSNPDIYALGDCAEVEGHVLPFVMPIMQCARALAATLVGNTMRVVYPAMPVVVKTPACPTVVSPPATGAEGDWQIEQDATGLKARFIGPDGALLGFALLGSATAERQALTTQLPAILPAA